MSKSNLVFLIVLLFTGAFFAVTVPVGLNYSTNSLLASEAETTGMAWARHIETRLPKLPGAVYTNDHLDPTNIITQKKLLGLLTDVINSGEIFQVDIVNPYCLCETSIGGYSPNQSDVPDDHPHAIHAPSSHFTAGDVPIRVSMDPEHTHDHAHIKNAQVPSRDGAENYFVIPIDRTVTANMFQHEHQPTIVNNGDGVSQPQKYAEVYHPVFSHGKPAYLLRILVNLDNKAATYKKLITNSLLIVLLLAVLSFIVPAMKYLSAAKKQKSADAKAHYLARTDILTKTANRNAFTECAPKILSECEQNNLFATLYIIDVNNFKTINDYHGHAAGDQVLKTIAKLLEEKVGNKGFLSRIGGDEFAILIKENTSNVTKIDVNKPIPINLTTSLKSVEVTLSAGYAQFPRDGADINVLLQNADLALYDAKTAKDARPHRYSPSMSKAFMEKIDLFDNFRKALSDSEIVPFYQPLINLQSGKLVGFEALARWNHPQKGIIKPDVFHPIFEDAELTALLGQSMIRSTMRDMGRWQQQGIDFQTVGINIGEGDLMRPGLTLDIAAGLQKYNLTRGQLAIEITENFIFGKNKELFVHKLQELKDLGCHVALDDFGTGYSSITQIKDLPINMLKIDKSFVNHVTKNAADQAIVSALILLGGQLGFKLIAEGVETQEQNDLLTKLNCTMAQGYLYSKPVTAMQVPSLIAKYNDTNSPTGTWSITGIPRTHTS